MNLSPNFDLKDMTHSLTAIRRGIPNDPPAEVIAELRVLAEKILEPVYKKFGHKMISSGYRSEALNKRLGGSTTSQHCKGQAVDIDGDIEKISNRDIFYYILDNLDYDQIIWEFGNDDAPAWVHVSYNRKRNRKRALRATKAANGKTIYLPFLIIS